MDKYEIFFREYSLRLGPLPYLIYGRKVSHSFLALSKNGETVEEIHGMSFSLSNKKFKVVTLNFTGIFNILSSVNVLRAFRVTGNPTKYEHSVLLSTSDTLDEWKACKEKAYEITRKRLKYKALFRQNCHTMAGNITLAVFGTDLSKHTKYKTPGIKNIIL